MALAQGQPTDRPGEEIMMMRFILLTLACLMLTFGSGRSALAAEDGKEVMALLEQMEASYSQVKDYTANFQKQERIGDKLKEKELIQVKFQKPFKVYMKWLEGTSKEALYVQGENSDKVQAHCPGLLGLWTWSFHPRDAALMKDNRHPITDIGLGFIIEMMRRDVPQALAHGELKSVRITDDTFDGRPAKRVEAEFTPGEGRKYYAARFILHVDKQYLLPIGITCYDEKDALVEQYGYKDLKVNVGLTAMDFSKANKSYCF